MRDEPMQRWVYSEDGDFDHHSFQPDESGPWVRAQEHLDAVAKLATENAQLRAAAEGLARNLEWVEAHSHTAARDAIWHVAVTGNAAWAAAKGETQT